MGILQIKKLSLERLGFFAKGKNGLEDTKGEGEGGTNWAGFACLHHHA